MTTTALGLALLVVCLLASSAVIAVGFRRLGTLDQADLFLRIFAAAGISAVGSVLLELFFTVDPSAALRIGADAAVALGPATVWVAVRSLRGRLLVPAAIAVGAALAVAVVSAVAARPGSFWFLLAVLAVFCGLAAREAWCEPLRRVRGHSLLGAALAVFAAYCVAALAVALIAGGESPAYVLVTSWSVWTAVSGAAIAGAGIAATLVARDLRPRRAEEASAGGSDGRRVRVAIPEFALMPSAFGSSAASFLDDQLLRAARETAPGARGIRPGACELVTADPPEDVERRVQARFAELSATADAFVGDLAFAWEPRRR